LTAILTERTVLIFVDIPLAILAAFLLLTRPRWMRRERQRVLKLAGMHDFEQDPAVLPWLACRECGTWPQHHVHTGDRQKCPCDECGKWNGTKDSARRSGMTRTPFAERLRLYTEARSAGEEPRNAAVAAGVDPSVHGLRYERWYQAQLAEAKGDEPPPPLSPELAASRRRSAARTRLDGSW
jgi:hypothetical protein